MTAQQLPVGWDEARIQRILSHYETQTEDEAVREDEAAFKERGRTVVEVPIELMPAIRELIGQFGMQQGHRTPRTGIN
ncbi:MAG: hypothetical protein QG637_1409 [Chloroflexota bacterium]|nr:hypothetical protein [Chloroflexota bacterium]